MKKCTEAKLVPAIQQPHPHWNRRFDRAQRSGTASPETRADDSHLLAQRENSPRLLPLCFRENSPAISRYAKLADPSGATTASASGRIVEKCVIQSAKVSSDGP